jgi:hypothetical protein
LPPRSRAARWRSRRERRADPSPPRRFTIRGRRRRHQAIRVRSGAARAARFPLGKRNRDRTRPGFRSSRCAASGDELRVVPLEGAAAPRVNGVPIPRMDNACRRGYSGDCWRDTRARPYVRCARVN